MSAAVLPDGTIVYAVGDIHGRLDLLDRLHARIRDHAGRHAATRRTLVHLGDYVDRGPDSRGVLDRLAGPAWPGWHRVDLMGNHERMLLDFLADPEAAAGPWFANGGRATLASFGIDGDALSPAAAAAALDAELGAGGRARLAALDLSWRCGGYFFVHAGIRPGVPLDRQRAHDLLWIRDPFLDHAGGYGAVVVHGHSIVAEPDDLPDRIGIDLGAVRHDRLGAVALAGGRREFLKVEGVVSVGPG